jgi:hypothetical protein
LQWTALRNILLIVDSMGLKFLGEGEWKRKKHQPEYRRQWHKLHIGIDAKTLQIHAIQLTTNNVSDSQVLIYLIRFHKMSRLTLFIPMELMIPRNAVRSLQIGKRMR